MEEKNEVKKTKSKKGLIIGLIVGVAVLLILAIVFFLLFIFKPKYKITVNAGGGTLTRNIVMEENTIKELPEVTPPEGKVLVAWINQDYEAIRPDIEITEDTIIVPVFEDENRETVTLKFVTGYELQISDIVITKGTKIILPYPPMHSLWTFIKWVDKNGFEIDKDIIVNEDMTIYAYWNKAESKQEEVTITFETGTKEKVEPIKVAKGSTYIFPLLKEKKEDLVLKGWLDPDGKLLTSEDRVKNDITLTAKWIEPYTCPDNCTPNEDGKTCDRKVERDMEHSSECIDPYEVVNGKCLDTANKFDPWSSGDDGLCPSGTYQWEICWGMGCERYCAKEVGFESGSWCPEGYAEENNKCVKTEIVECIEN